MPSGLFRTQADLDAARFQARRSVLVAPADGTVLDVFVDDGQTAGAGQPVLRFAGVLLKAGLSPFIVGLNNLADKVYETAYGYNQPGREGYVTLRWAPR